MFNSINWGDVALVIAMFAFGIAIIVGRLKPEQRRSIAEHLRPGHYFTQKHAAPTHEAHGTHHGDSHGGHHSSGVERPVFAAVLIAVGIIVMLVAFFIGGKSPSPDSLAEAIRHRWLVFGIAILLLYIGAGFADNRWGLKKIAHAVTAFIVLVGLFGTSFGEPKMQHRRTQLATAEQPVPSRPIRAPIVQKWGGSALVPAAGPSGDSWLWIEGAEGYTLRPCSPTTDPNCDAKDLSSLLKIARLRCRIGNDVFDYESGRCFAQHAFGIQSRGEPFGILYYDVPNTQAYASTELAQAPVEPEPVAEPEEEQASAPAPEPTATAPEPRTYVQPLAAYRSETP